MLTDARTIVDQQLAVVDLLLHALPLTFTHSLLGEQALPPHRYLGFIPLKLGKVNDLSRIGFRPAVFLPITTPQCHLNGTEFVSTHALGLGCAVLVLRHFLGNQFGML